MDSSIDQHFRGKTKTVLVPAIIGTVGEMHDYWPGQHDVPQKIFVLPGSKNRLTVAKENSKRSKTPGQCLD